MKFRLQVAFRELASSDGRMQADERCRCPEKFQVFRCGKLPRGADLGMSHASNSEKLREAGRALGAR
jgi:hypothetical protein